MLSRFASWLSQRSASRALDPVLADDFRMAFSTPSGQRVLKHLLDTIYCEAHESVDHNAALVFIGRRSVIHEILFNIDVSEHPERYYTELQISALAEGGFNGGLKYG